MLATNCDIFLINWCINCIFSYDCYCYETQKNC